MITLNGKHLALSEGNLKMYANAAVAAALKSGASSASCRVGASEGVALSVRDGALQEYETEPLKIDVTLSVWQGQKMASVSATGADDDVIRWLVREGIGNAKILTEDDPHRRLATSDEYMADIDAQQKALDMVDDKPRPTLQEMVDIAVEIERGMMSVDGFTKSYDAGVSWNASIGAYATSEGLATASRRSGFNAYGVAGCEGEDGVMAQDYKQVSKVHFEDLEQDWFAFGQEITDQTLRQRDEQPLGASGKMPVVFDRKVATSLIGHILSAMDGMAVFREQTFLNGKLGEKAFDASLTIYEDPLKVRGLASGVCSRMGVPRIAQNLVEDGVVRTWLLGLRAASHLNMAPTGHDGGVSNVLVPAGDVSVDELIADIDCGIYITSLMGHGYDTVTGNYSRSAGGFAIKNGKITHPIKNCVITSTMADMFSEMTFADDLLLERSLECPTVRIADMMVSA